MEKKANKSGSMKTVKHSMTENKTKNREEFISDQPNDFDDRNLDREGINKPESKKTSDKKDRRVK